MSYSVKSLEPKALWNYFEKICGIPHGSGNVKQLGEAICSWAGKKGFEAATDEVGSVVVRIPASKGCEKAPTVVLQSHLDMVCEKNADTKFDFLKDGIALERDGDWLTAQGTTLGADNGIGLAAGLAFMDLADAKHGPLELFMTVDEETGLVGAQNLKPDFIKGRLLFNMDSEEDGVFYVGCAGGRDSAVELPIETVPAPAGHVALKLEVKGLRGGHSGLDIIQNRGNALRLLTRAIGAGLKEVNVQVSSIFGGDKHNAIPREASAVVVVPSADRQKFEKILDAQYKGFRSEFASHEPEISLTAVPTDSPKTVLDENSRNRAVRLLLGLPHGVLAMVRDMDGLVETSSNMARVRFGDGSVIVLNSSRSSVGAALEGVVQQIEAVGLALGAKVTILGGYPAWQPNMESKMLARAKAVWKKVHGGDAKFTVVHAGLECGIIGEKCPGMDMISLGPTIQHPHSPNERVHIPSVSRFFDFTKAFLADLTTA